MKEVLNSLLAGQILSETAAENALRDVLTGEIPPPQAAAFLAALQMRGLHLPELRGFHKVLREKGQKLDFSDFELIDVCGTGGDGKHTFNISTMAAFVLAGAEIKVAKHGNFSATSGCGSSDVLQFLGVKFTNDEDLLRRQIEEINICYLHAPLFQSALKTVAPLRQEIGFRTFFNLLGPLLNPAAPRHQFIGVVEPAIMRLYRYFLEDSAVNFALVNTRDGYDEISLTAAFDIMTNETAETFYPEDLNFATIKADELDGGQNVTAASAKFMQILRNENSEAQAQIVIINAAFAMRLMKPQFSIEECRKRCQQSLFSGAALRAFNDLLTFKTV